MSIRSIDAYKVERSSARSHQCAGNFEVPDSHHMREHAARQIAHMHGYTYFALSPDSWRELCILTLRILIHTHFLDYGKNPSLDHFQVNDYSQKNYKSS